MIEINRKTLFQHILLKGKYKIYRLNHTNLTNQSIKDTFNWLTKSSFAQAIKIIDLLPINLGKSMQFYNQ